MPRFLTHRPVRERVNLIAFCTFLSVSFFLGGASRADVLSLPFARLAAIAMIAMAVVQMDRDQWREMRVQLLFAVTLSLCIAMQLVPMPPELWFSLPGHEMFRAALAAAGVGDVWRPLSLTPDRTLNSLLAMLFPVAAIAGLAIVDRRAHRFLVPLMLVGIILGAVAGLAQMSSGGPYFYEITNQGFAVGFFANRNHLAIFMSLTFPLAACWALLPQPDSTLRKVRSWLALCMTAAICPLLLTTGSRTGLLLGAMGFGLGIVLWIFSRRGNRIRWPKRVRDIPIIVSLPVITGIAAISAVIALSRDVAVRRLLTGEAVELRADYLPIYLRMMRDYFPVGSGFGSFDPVFRLYEPNNALTGEYMNQAHNDLVQIVIEGGGLSVLLLAVFVLWFCARVWALWIHPVRSEHHLLGRLGSIIAFMILASSVVDYPLRTPFIAAIMAIATHWMARQPRTDAAAPDATPGVGSHSELG